MLPAAIETILSFERPGGGGFIAEMGGTITNVPAFPPNTTLTTTLTPPAGMYAIIVFFAQASPNMVPDAFTVHIQHTGHGIYGGNWSSLPISTGVPGYAVVTDNAPMTIVSINTSGLTQRAEMGYLYAAVSSTENYALIVQMLRERSKSGSEGFRQQLLALASKMVAHLPRLPLPVP